MQLSFFLHGPRQVSDGVEEVQAEERGLKLVGIAKTEEWRGFEGACTFILQCLQDMEFFSDPISHK